ncbi:MAG: hypothetical protein ACI9TH_004867 [Kiritimatiellia bacterium]|jgi:hypothetical protein
MKVSCYILLSLLFAGALHAENVQFRGVLIQASSTPGPADPKLANIQKKLGNFPYKSFSYVGEGQGEIDVPGKISFGVGGGSTLDVEAVEIAGKQVKTSLQWKRGGKTAIDTTIGINKGSGTILGGPKNGNGVLILYLTVK